MKYIIKEVTLDTGMYNLSDKLDNLEFLIAMCREKLMMLGASSPRTIIDAENSNIEWNEHVQFEINLIVNDLDEYMYERTLVRIAIDNPDLLEEISN